MAHANKVQEILQKPQDYQEPTQEQKDNLEKLNMQFDVQSFNFGKNARVLVNVTDTKYMPIAGSVGQIQDGEYRFNMWNSNRVQYIYIIRFAIPCRLVGGGCAVNDDIVSQEKEEWLPYQEKHGFTYMGWEENNLPYLDIAFWENEIEILAD
jgi:hypothetical protein